MRISDLSRQTGVPVATIKFYLRERLMPAGTPTGRNQADYGDEHLRRLRTIRALTNIAHLDLSSVRVLLAAITNEDLSLPALFTVASRTLLPNELDMHDPSGVKRAAADVDRLIDDVGWQIERGTPGRAGLAAVLAALRRLGCECGIEFFLPFAQTAETLAKQELDLLPADVVGADRAAAVVRTILLEVALDALRRMAHEHCLAIWLSRPAPAEASAPKAPTTADS